MRQTEAWQGEGGGGGGGGGHAHLYRLAEIMCLDDDNFVEILSPGFRSIENPEAKAVQESTIQHSDHGPVQHAVSYLLDYDLW